MQLTIHHAPPTETRPDRLVLRFPPSDERGHPPAGGPPLLSLDRGETVLAALPPGRSATITFSGRVPKGAILVVSPACTLIRDPSEPVTLTDLDSGGEGPPPGTVARIGRRPRREVICIRPEILYESLTADGKPHPSISAGRVGLLLADGVHRLSFWHPDFDPAYRRLPALIAALREKSRHLTALGVTAPVSGQVDRELRNQLKPHRNWAPPAPADAPLPPIEVIRADGAEAKERLCAGLTDRLRQALEHGRPGVVWSRWEPASAPPIQPNTGPGPLQPIILTHEAAPTPRKPARPLSAPDFRPRYTPPHAALSRPVEPFGPPADPSSAPTGGLWVSSEARTPGLPPPSAWVIQTALSGGLDDWRDRTWPRPAGGAAALLMADLPDPACESDRSARATLTPACVDGSCPFGRLTLCDDGIGHREIEAAVPSPRSVCREGVRVVKALLAGEKTSEGSSKETSEVSSKKTSEVFTKPRRSSQNLGGLPKTSEVFTKPRRSFSATARGAIGHLPSPLLPKRHRGHRPLGPPRPDQRDVPGPRLQAPRKSRPDGRRSGCLFPGDRHHDGDPAGGAGLDVDGRP